MEFTSERPDRPAGIATSLFSEELMWKRWPVWMHTVDGDLHFVRKITEEANRRNIRLFFEVKEISHPAALLALAPDLQKSDGAVCASDPSMDGIIVSPAEAEQQTKGITGGWSNTDVNRNYLIVSHGNAIIEIIKR